MTGLEFLTLEGNNFTGEGLVRELGGGGHVLHEGPWFVVVRA